MLSTVTKNSVNAIIFHRSKFAFENDVEYIIRTTILVNCTRLLTVLN